MAFNIRELSSNVSYTAILYINGIASTLIAQISDGSVSFKIKVNSNIQLNELDLISIKVTFSNGALQNGACITLVAKQN